MRRSAPEPGVDADAATDADADPVDVADRIGRRPRRARASLPGRKPHPLRRILGAQPTLWHPAGGGDGGRSARYREDGEEGKVHRVHPP